MKKEKREIWESLYVEYTVRRRRRRRRRRLTDCVGLRWSSKMSFFPRRWYWKRRDLVASLLTEKGSMEKELRVSLWGWNISDYEPLGISALLVKNSILCLSTKQGTSKENIVF